MQQLLLYMLSKTSMATAQSFVHISYLILSKKRRCKRGSCIAFLYVGIQQKSRFLKKWAAEGKRSVAFYSNSLLKDSQRMYNALVLTDMVNEEV